MSRNRMANARNHFQGPAKKVLCVCSAGLLRSPTAAYVLATEFGFNTRAVGLTKEYALIPMDEVLAYWADEIVVMEPWMVDAVKEFVDPYHNPKVTCLNVPDQYEFMAPELQTFIFDAYMKTGKKEE